MLKFRLLWRLLWLGGLFFIIDSVRRHVIRYREYGSIMNTITVNRNRGSATQIDTNVKSPDNDVAFPILLVCAHSPISRSKGE